MVKITFEVSEDFIREGADSEKALAKAGEGKNAIRALFDVVGFKQIEDQLDKGKTEFIVTPDKLDDKSIDLYNREIGSICMLAAFSETDNAKKEAE